MSGSTTNHGAIRIFSVASCFFLYRVPILIGLLACISVLARIDLAEDVNWSADGPGLTFDEVLNLESGVYIVESVIQSGLGALHPGTYYDIFSDQAYHPDYPPLGRLPAALANAVLFRVLGGVGHELYVITYARAGTAVVFGLLVCLISGFTQHRAGMIAGIASGLILWFTPRVFGHAHLASVETMMNLSYAGCVLLTLLWLAPRTTLKARDGIVPGVLLGLALLTKIQAIFLPPVLTVWILWNWRKNGIAALAVTAAISFLVFLAGWPWLWSDPIGGFLQYFGQTTDRATLYCYYFGERYSDKAVPWHYPWVMFALTTPLPYLVAGIWGAIRYRSNGTQSVRENQLLMGAFLFPLIVFSLPGVAVYDGERLFLIVWPIFAVWGGIAIGQLADWGCKRWTRRFALVVLIGIALPAVNLVYFQPCYLSYYNLVIGGLAGANRAGLEPTYWGDTLTPAFLRQMSEKLPERSALGVAPVLHPSFVESLRKDSWLRHRPDLILLAYDDKAQVVPRNVLVIRRMADSWESLNNPPEGTIIKGRVTRSGVPLAEMIQLP